LSTQAAGELTIVSLAPVQESDLDRIISSNQPLTDQHFQYFLYQVHKTKA
jgi:hypothetical protein